jgi:hypothetical protein
MSVFIVLKSPALVGGRLACEIQEIPATGYRNSISTKAGKRLTHFKVVEWKSGNVEDFTVKFKLMAGVQDIVPDPARLLSVVEHLRDLALPPAGRNRGLESLTVIIHGSSHPWFSCSAVVEGIKEAWEAPYDEATGIPMVCEVTLSLKPVYAGVKGIIGKIARKLPARPWKFSNQSVSER